MKPSPYWPDIVDTDSWYPNVTHHTLQGQERLMGTLAATRAKEHA